MDSQLMQGRLDDPLWRLQHLYWIENKAGRMQRFTLNAAQLRLHRAMWNRNAVLKARQLGISTYVAMLMLDCCLFTPNFHAGIIDKSLPDAEQKLAKVRFAWENLDYAAPDADAAERALAYLGGLIKQRTGALKRGELHPVGDARTRMAFANGSDIRLGTTLRGGTLQLLHVSELAHVSVHAPWRAREIRTGAINTVPADGRIILESTHEGGRYGVNYEMMQQAMENSAKDELSPWISASSSSAGSTTPSTRSRGAAAGAMPPRNTSRSSPPQALRSHTARSSGTPAWSEPWAPP